MSDTLEKITFEIGKAFSPLSEAFSSVEALESFLEELGWDSSSILNIPDAIVDVVNSLADLLAILNDILADGEPPPGQMRQLLGLVKRLVEAIDDISAGAGLPPSLIDAGFPDLFPRQLLDYLLSQYLLYNQPTIGHLLGALGIIRIGYVPPAGERLGYVDYTFAFEDIPAVLDDPQVLIRNAYGWGTDDFDAAPLFRHAENLLAHWGAHVYVEYQEAGSVALLSGKSSEDERLTRALKASIFDTVVDGARVRAGLGFFALPKFDALKPGLSLLPFAEGSLEEKFQVGNRFSFSLKTSFDMQGGLGIAIRPERDLIFVTGFSDPASAAQASGELRLRLAHERVSRSPIIVLGSPGGSRLEYRAFSLASGIYIDNQPDPDLFAEAELVEGKVVIKASGGDGFLQTILPGDGIAADFDLAVGISSRNGLYFRGSAGLEIRLPTHFSLGPLEFNALTLSVSPSGDAIPISAGATVKANLGPLSASIENIGLRAALRFRGDNSGNLGPIDFDLGFKPPNGVGLAIDAGVVKGGGYLYFDFDREEYAGALELTFSDYLSLKAIGLITTRMPDGSSGFSLLIIITAEFTIQLGYGFVFLGAGGLLGLHRTVRLEPLAEGVRSGATANIMFPTNVVENAPRIISDLRTFFPPEEGKFLIGPMVKLGWGTPTLISISLGIIIEIRTADGGAIERIAILGVLKCILPDQEAAILVLQVNFIGAIDFQKKTAFFFASLFESRVLYITIEGEMGVLVAWGEDANFLVSVGGFHPRFSPPPLPFPVPKRVSLNILNESWGKIRVQGYFAVTTNTAQFGARAELWFGFSEFKVAGHLSFDALFQFDPFYFILDISAKASLKVFGVGCFSISLKFTLEGPTPWRAQGYGRIKILFFSFKARFDETWGERRDTTLPPIEVLPILEAEFGAMQNWQASLPASSSLLVSLRELPEPAEDQPESLVLHPVGALRVSQRAIPLEIRLDKVGNQTPEDANRFAISVSGGPLTKEGDREELFARAQSQDMDDAKKLSSPAYEPEVAGLHLSASGRQTRSARMTVRHVRYELVTIDTNYRRFQKKIFGWVQVLFAHFLGRNAAALSTLSHRTERQRQPFAEKVEVRRDTYVVAWNTNNTPLDGAAAAFNSQARAEAFMMKTIAQDPQMAEVLHVIPAHEVNTTV